MYLKVSNFLLSHEYLNMDKVPGFYQFFYSSDLEVCFHSPHGLPQAPELIMQPPLSTAVFPMDTVCCTAHTIVQAVTMQACTSECLCAVASLLHGAPHLQNSASES